MTRPRRPDATVDPGAEPRRIAIDALRRIADEGAYANLLVPALLADSDLDQRDRNLVTELVYGATRMQRAVDWLVDRFVSSPPPPALRASLRIGAYQLAFMRVPAHAAVSATVSAAPKRFRSPVNAILRRVAESLPVDSWPSEAIRLSYPDWLFERLIADLGEADALAALERMNQPPSVTERADGYVQDLASQWVVDVVDPGPDDLILDACAAPGGKATAMASSARRVVAADARFGRARLVTANAQRLDMDAIDVVTADGRRPCFRAQSFDRVLVDAPCSGIGVLRRRPDARWRVGADDIDELVDLQLGLLDAAVGLVRPGGRLVYSVCTLTVAETIEVAEALTTRHRLAPVALPPGRWRPLGTGGRILPQDHDTDGMAVFSWQVGD